VWALSLLHGFAGVPGLEVSAVPTRYAMGPHCAITAALAALAAGLGSAVAHADGRCRPGPAGCCVEASPRTSLSAPRAACSPASDGRGSSVGLPGVVVPIVAGLVGRDLPTAWLIRVIAATVGCATLAIAAAFTAGIIAGVGHQPAGVVVGIVYALVAVPGLSSGGSGRRRLLLTVAPRRPGRRFRRAASRSYLRRFPSDSPWPLCCPCSGTISWAKGERVRLPPTSPGGVSTAAYRAARSPHTCQEAEVSQAVLASPAISGSDHQRDGRAERHGPTGAG
jgi:hypothetical protein